MTDLEQRVEKLEKRVCDLESNLATAARLADILAEGFKVLSQSHSHYQEFMSKLRELLVKILPGELNGNSLGSVSGTGTDDSGRGLA